MVRAALVEPRDELQSAAVRALVDPAGLNRADLVVERFGELLPAALAVAHEHCAELIAEARRIMSRGSSAERLAAQQLVAALADDEAVQLLSLGLDDAMAEVRQVALDALEVRLGEFVATRRQDRADGEPEPEPEPEDAEDDAFWQVFEKVVGSFAQHGRSSFLTLFAGLGDKGAAILVRVMATQQDVQFKKELFAALVDADAASCAEFVFVTAGHKSPALRVIGRQLMGRRRDRRFALALSQHALDLDPVRRAAIDHEVWLPTALAGVNSLPSLMAQSLLEIIVSEVGDPLLAQRHVEAFLGHSETAVVKAALGHIGRLGCKDGFEGIARVLESGCDEVRHVAAMVVIDLAPPEKVPLLMPLLGAEDADLRRLAMREVSQASFARFLQRFDGMDQEARQIAARALSKIDSGLIDRVADEFAALDPDRRIKALKIVELLDAGVQLREPLLELLEDPDLRVRATAIRIVQLTGSVDGIKVLIDALSHEDHRMRANAIEAFEQLDDPCYLELLVPFLRDRDNRVRANAAKALWNLGWAEARDVLVAMASDSDPRMRLSAVWAIGEVGFSGAQELLASRQLVERDAAVLVKLRDAMQGVLSVDKEEQ